MWAFTEAGQQTLTLFAFDKWRVAYATADELTRAQIRTNTMMYTTACGMRCISCC